MLRVAPDSPRSEHRPLHTEVAEFLWLVRLGLGGRCSLPDLPQVPMGSYPLFQGVGHELGMLDREITVLSAFTNMKGSETEREGPANPMVEFTLETGRKKFVGQFGKGPGVAYDVFVAALGVHVPEDSTSPVRDFCVSLGTRAATAHVVSAAASIGLVPAWTNLALLEVAEMVGREVQPMFNDYVAAHAQEEFDRRELHDPYAGPDLFQSALLAREVSGAMQKPAHVIQDMHKKVVRSAGAVLDSLGLTDQIFEKK